MKLFFSAINSISGIFRFAADKTNEDRPADRYRQLIFSGCCTLASIFNSNVDTIEFRNCSNIPYPLFLTADPAKKVTCLQLISSNVTNIHFDYTEKFSLYFDKDISEETKIIRTRVCWPSIKLKVSRRTWKK